MLKRLAIATAALTMLAAPSVQADELVKMTKGEKRLAKMLEGRVAGEPESCIRTTRSRSLVTIDGTALVYESGNTVWVNYTSHPRSIDDSDFLVIDRFSTSELCRTDRITTYSRGGGFFSGVIMLGDFVPYRRADAG